MAQATFAGGIFHFAGAIAGVTLLAPPVPLEQLEGALMEQSNVLGEELKALKKLLEQTPGTAQMRARHECRAGIGLFGQFGRQSTTAGYAKTISFQPSQNARPPENRGKSNSVPTFERQGIKTPRARL